MRVAKSLQLAASFAYKALWIAVSSWEMKGVTKIVGIVC